MNLKSSEKQLDRLRKIIQFFTAYVPSQQLQGQLQKQLSVNITNYITMKRQHKDNSHKVSLGHNTMEKNYYFYNT
jgi:hypothetical protein